ncbi:MAG TPA: hypothetical protein DDZ89_11610 [Clostridiales bacterium]|nr:hypothetical protein [Clostridiales bacterium]
MFLNSIMKLMINIKNDVMQKVMFNQPLIFHFNKLFDQMNRKVGPYIIYQVGDLCSEPGYRVGTHIQYNV